MADEIIRLDYSAEDIGDNIDEVRTARGTFDTLDDRLDNIEGGGPSPSNPIASNCVSPMTGYSKSSSSTPGNISTSDTLNAAIGKLERRTELNENNISLLCGKTILNEQANTSRTLTYTMKIADFGTTAACGIYMIYIVNWSTTPSISIYIAYYSGGVATNSAISKIAGADATVSVSGDTISVTSSGKIQIIAMQ